MKWRTDMMIWIVLFILGLTGYIFFDTIHDQRIEKKIADQEKRIEDLEEKLKYIMSEIGKEDFK